MSSTLDIMHTTARRLDLAYRAKGHGPTLVLLHAFPFNQDMWEPQLEGLSDVAHVITLDLPGFGASQTTDGDFSLDTMAEIVHDFVRHLGHERVVLGGLSMGGYIALAYARKYPAHLQGLILADTRANADTPEARKRRLEQIQEINQFGLLGLSESMPHKVLTPATAVKRPALLKELGGHIAASNVMAVTGALEAMANRPDAMDVLPGIHVPTLVIVGEGDELTPPTAAQEMVDHLPNGKLVSLPGAGHMSNLEAPEAFNQAVADFMRQFTR
ncbi:MAG: catD [Cyanobacteria bacterium RYN_339]|nr:catD [Cyanobacteria bacterium RYN_339]